MSSNLLEYDPDRYSDNFAQAGPISSYKTLEARIIVSSASPIAPPKVRAPIAASPMATPACGIKASPRLLRTFLFFLASRQPKKAPLYLPSILVTK